MISYLIDSARIFFPYLNPVTTEESLRAGLKELEIQVTNIEMYQWSNGKSRGTALVTVKNVEQTLDIVTRHNLEIDGWTVEPKMMLVSRSGVL